MRNEIRHRLSASRAPVFVVDAIKLIEGGLYKKVDSVWVVTCEPVEQRRRLTEHRGLSPEEAEARISAQPAQAEKLPFADVVIDNSGSLEAARQQVQSAWARTVAANISP